MGKRIVIDWPHLPHPALRGNARSKNHFHRAKLKAEQRILVGWLAKEAAQHHGIDQPIEKAVVTYHFYTPNASRCDDVNFLAGCKGATDGLVDGGLIVSDSNEHIQHRGVFHRSKRIDTRTEIIIEEE